MHKFIYNLLKLLIFPQILWSQSQPLIEPFECMNGNGTNYFNSLLYRCESCPEGLISTGFTCSCDRDSISINGTCRRCPDGRVPSPDRSFCIECLGDQCGCLSNNTIINYRSPNGQPLSKATCTKCANDTIADMNSQKCIPCLESPCQCAECLTNTRLNGNIGNFKSPLIDKWLPISQAGCQRQDLASCQLLYNLCVLQNYAQVPDNACSVYGDIASSTMRNRIPSPPLTVQYPTAKTLGGPPNPYKFDNTDFGRLTVFLSSIYLNGTLKSFDPIERSELFPASPSTIHRAFTFGVFFSLQTRVKLSSACQNEGIFYELFLKVPGNSSTNEQMVPIYVASSLLNPEMKLETTIQNVDQLVLQKRFFIYDSKSLSMNNSTTMIRHVNQMDFTIYLESSRDGKIGIPILKVFYSTFQSINIEGLELPFTLGISYFQDPFRHDKDMEITMAVLCSCSVIWAGLRAYSWGRRSAKQLADASTLFQIIFYECDVLGDIFLFVITTMACWLTFAYKSQTYVYYRLLLHPQETTMEIYVCVATLLKFISFIYNRMCLVRTDTFFIDWEKPKIVADLNKNQPPSRDIAKDRLIIPPVIWRTYLVANEWNELQTYRKTSLPLQIVLMPFILEYLGWIHFATVQPGFSAEQPSEGFMSTKVTRWAVVMFIYLSTVFLQWAMSVLIVERIVVDPFHNLIDLCSVANISVFSLTHSHHGYYIHGRSVHGRADTNMREMNEFLQRERDNMCGFRGLETNSELQTYIINLPIAFRQKLDQIRQTSVLPNNLMRSAGQDPATAKVSVNSKAHESLNAFLMDVIDRSVTGIDYRIRDQSFIEAFLDLELDDTTVVGSFMRDPSETAFSSCFSYGHEWSAVSLEALLYCVSFLLTDSLIFSSFIVFSLYFLSSKIFSSLFTSHLVQSSCVDHRFLI